MACCKIFSVVIETSRCRITAATWLASAAVYLGPSVSNAQDLAKWTVQPADWKGANFKDGNAYLTAQGWSFLRSPEDYTHADLSATVTIAEAAKHFGFFGSSWSAWPDSTYGDDGFEAALLLHAGATSGYRVQVSHKYQVVALVKYPEGGYVRVVPCDVKLKQPHVLQARVAGNQIVVSVDGKEKLRYLGTFLPLDKGQVGVGVSSGAKVVVSNLLPLKKSPPAPPTPFAKTAPPKVFHAAVAGRSALDLRWRRADLAVAHCRRSQLLRQASKPGYEKAPQLHV